MSSAFGRHGSIARGARRLWRVLPISNPVKEAVRRFILDRLGDLYHLVEHRSGIGFHPSERHRTTNQGYAPWVTVVVPNYNHAPYLRQRLESIYGQTYSHFRVVLLDDCSTDDSRSILCEYAERYPEITRLDFNTTNSGGVFRQWLKAIESAETQLIWIAESDDYVDSAFLERLVPLFMDDAVRLAYSHSVFVTESGEPLGFTFEDYVGELSFDHWRRSYVTTAHEEVARYLGRKNTIPNVSSAIFRRFDLSRLVERTQWLDMRICGDWVFYLHAARGGKIAYCADVNNYYRFHAGNASAKTYATEDYYREHEEVACEIARLYRAPAETLEAHREFIRRFFDQNARALETRGISFDELYAPERVRQAAEERLPNILVAGFAFASGGGEIFPIRLANTLAEHGYGVTYFDFRGEPMNPVVRDMLEPGLPVVELTNRFLESDAIIKAFGIEVVHTHHASVDRFFGMVRRRPMPPAAHVITMHGMYDDMNASSFDRTLMDIYPGVSTWVYISEKNLAPFREQGYLRADRFVKIPNGIPTPTISAISRETLGIAETAFVLCVASRAIPSKGWRESIQAVAEARRISGLDIHLVLLGDGPVYEALRHDSQPAFIHLLGFVSQTVDYYAMADAGLLLSTFSGESFPLTVIECLVAGRPVIATDIGEIRQMITDDSGAVAGHLVDISENRIPVSSVARKVAELALDPHGYAALCGLAEKISPRFDMERVVDRYGAVYRAAVAGMAARL